MSMRLALTAGPRRNAEHEARGIGLPADAQRMDLELCFTSGNCRADFEHVRTEYFHAFGIKVVGIIFHKGTAAF